VEDEMTSIEWVKNGDGSRGQTWNPIVGCSRISAGCQHCYAEVMTKRLEAMGQPKYAGLLNKQGRFNGVTRFDEEALLIPLRRKKPTTYFVNSMSDLFHESIPDEWIDKVFAVMALSPQHIFQVLTKRADRMERYVCTLRSYDGPLSDFWLGDALEADCGKTFPALKHTRIDKPLPNVWLGVSAENQEEANARIPHLLDTPAAVRFVSAEPLLGPVDIRRFFRYDPIYEKQAKRDVCLSGREERGYRDSIRRNDLEAAQAGLGPVEIGGDQSPMQACASGARQRGILPNQGDAGRETSDGAGAPTGMASFPRTDPRGDNAEPQERHQEGQSPVQLGACDLQRTANSCDSSAEDRPCLRPTWSEEQHVKADHGSSGANPAEKIGRGTTEVDSCGLWGDVPSHIKDCQRASEINLVIVGGESGPGARPCNVEWIRSIVGQCKAADVPVFVKQLGSNIVTQHPMDRDALLKIRLANRKGGDPAEWPEDLRVREMPSRGGRLFDKEEVDEWLRMKN